MKVYSFLEYQELTFKHPQEWFEEFETILNKFIKWSEDEDGEYDILKFYAQPFKPEMIMELFEGWEICMNEKKFIQVANNDKLITYRKINNSYAIHDVEFYTNPRTLDDFITDCLRAGIELEWREI